MPSSLATPPDAVLDGVVAYCDYAELFACSHTNRAWRRRTGTSVAWRRIAQADLDRARSTEYQVVATPVQKRVGLASSFNTAHLFAVEVRTRHRQRTTGGDAEGIYGYGGSAGSGSGGWGGVPPYAQNLQQYTFGSGGGGGGPTTAIGSAVSRAYGGMSGGALERNPSSTCFSTLGSTAMVRRVCMRYILPLRFTAGEAVAAALRHANAAPARPSTTDAADTPSRPLWEDGSILRPGVLLCDPADPCTFLYYAATLHRPWCTVLMDECLVDDAFLVDFIESSREASSSSGGYGGGAATSAAAAACFDLAFRVEELPIVRNDPRNPSHLVEPAQPVSIRIGVVEASQLEAYRRGVQHVVRAMTFFSPHDATDAQDKDNDSDSGYGGDASPTAAPAVDSVWGALDTGMRSRGAEHNTNSSSGGWGLGGGGGAAENNDVDDAAAAEAEVAAWLQASVEASLRPAHGAPSAATATTTTAAQPLQFWSQEPSSAPPAPSSYARRGTASRRSGPSRVPAATTGAEEEDGDAGAAYVLGDTAGSFGYDTEGGFISEASSYPLGAPLQKDDVVHLQFFHDEDVIVVTRNRERLGTIVADAFSERQQWCVAVSLQNCGVRFIPPRLN